jgi:hypothetical protein
MEWGSSFAGADIGLREGKLNRKSEALDMKNDTGRARATTGADKMSCLQLLI